MYYYTWIHYFSSVFLPTLLPITVPSSFQHPWPQTPCKPAHDKTELFVNHQGSSVLSVASSYRILPPATSLLLAAGLSKSSDLKERGSRSCFFRFCIYGVISFIYSFIHTKIAQITTVRLGHTPGSHPSTAGPSVGTWSGAAEEEGSPSSYFVISELCGRMNLRRLVGISPGKLPDSIVGGGQVFLCLREGLLQQMHRSKRHLDPAQGATNRQA